MKHTKTMLGAFLASLTALATLPAPLNAQNTAPAADQAPKAIYRLNPDYSFDLRHDQIQGFVDVAFTVTPSGDVADAAIVSSTERRLNRPTLSAITKWRFAPATKAGVPVSSRVIQRVAYKMVD